MRSAIAAVAGAVERLLLPSECLVCRRVIPDHEPDTPVCRGCLLRLRPVPPPWCERCGQPRPLFGPCRLCARWPEALVHCRSAAWLDDTGRILIHALKYDGMHRLAEPLAEWMARRLPPPPTDAVLVPVPLAAQRLRERGYNQSELLARALGERWGLPVEPQRLARVRETATQTALTPEARLANVAGAFTPGRRAGVGPSEPTPVLVDDVFTTGATLAEAAGALVQGGARRLCAVTFGRAAIPDFT